MTIDEIVLKALEGGGPVTISDIVTRFAGPVRSKLEKLRRHGAVVRDGKGGVYREFTYTLLRPNRAAEALTEKGGLSPAKAAKATLPPPQLLSDQVASAARQHRRVFLKRGSDHFRTRHKQKGS
jgi:hypothetical protein